MALTSLNAEDTCLKNHPYRNHGISPPSTSTLRDITPCGSAGDLEKLHSVHEDAHIASAVPGDGHDDGTVDAARTASRRLSTTSTLTFPEGGLSAWLVVVGCFSAMLSVFGLINSSAVFESYFSTHQLKEYSASQLGWIFSLYLFMVFFVGIQVGPIFDHYGPRWVVAIGSLLMLLSIMLLGFCTGE